MKKLELVGSNQIFWVLLPNMVLFQIEFKNLLERARFSQNDFEQCPFPAQEEEFVYIRIDPSSAELLLGGPTMSDMLFKGLYSLTDEYLEKAIFESDGLRISFEILEYEVAIEACGATLKTETLLAEFEGDPTMMGRLVEIKVVPVD